MTFKEWMEEKNPKCVSAVFAGGVRGCPSHYGLESEDSAFCRKSCRECWGREMPKKEEIMNYDHEVFPVKKSYWDKICDINARQEAKGKEKYGETLEDNTTLTTIQRIEHAEEEAIDLLKYLEHLKEVASDGITANDYQRAALRTANEDSRKTLNGVMGLCGETGKCIDIVKKHMFQGHDLDEDKLIEELGDVARYLALTAHSLDLTLGEIMQRNIDKLMVRYPDGFDKARSINREGK